MKTHFEVIGMMSGTSLDGMDLAFCIFDFEDTKWTHKIKIAETIPYEESWRNRLDLAIHLSGLELSLLNIEYGHLIGETINKFCKNHSIVPDFIASHGHTVFHQPDRLLTLQIGDGAAIAAKARCTVINQFRNTDLALGGQGAPLVPIGDKLLFGHIDFCLNLGGIANISFDKDQRIAFDICPCNMPLNLLAKELDMDYDEGGKTAEKGKINPELLDKLNNLDFYLAAGPKSLGIEWFHNHFKPLLDRTHSSTADKLRTVCEHISIQISNIINQHAKSEQAKLLVTGGGAKNAFLMSLIRSRLKSVEIIETDDNTIDFKEALIFAFLGVLRYRNEANCLSSVTGAEFDNTGGAIYHFSDKA